MRVSLLDVSGRKSGTRRGLAAVLLICALHTAAEERPAATAAPGSESPTGGSYVLRKFVVAGGGVDSTASNLHLVATVGEIAGVQLGGSYRLTGGFHQPGAATGTLFCDGFESTPCN